MSRTKVKPTGLLLIYLNDDKERQQNKNKTVKKNCRNQHKKINTWQKDNKT